MKLSASCFVAVILLALLQSSLPVQAGSIVPGNGHGGDLLFAVLSPDNQYILTAGEDQTVRLWEMSTGRLARVIAMRVPLSLPIVFMPDSQSFVTRGQDDTLRVWACHDGRQRKAFLGPHGGFISSMFYPSRVSVQQALSQEFNLESSLFSNVSKSKYLQSMQITKDGRRVLVLGDDRTAYLYELISGMQLGKFKASGDIDATGISSDGALVMISDRRGLRFWKTDTGKTVGYLKAVSGALWLGFTEEGESVAVEVSKFPAAVRSWNWQTGKCVSEIKLSAYPDHRILSADCKTLYDKDGNEVVLRDTRTGKVIRKVFGTSMTESFTPSSDGRFLLFYDQFGKLSVVDVPTATPVRRLSTCSRPTSGVAFSPDGKHILTADGLGHLWDLDTGSMVKTIGDSIVHVARASWSSDGTLLLTGGSSLTLLWEFNDGTPVISNALSSGSAVFSPDGKFILVGGESVALYDRASPYVLWRWHRREFVKKLQPSTPIATTGFSEYFADWTANKCLDLSARFSPDGVRAVIAGGCDSVRIVDGRTGALLRSFEQSCETFQLSRSRPDAHVVIPDLNPSDGSDPTRLESPAFPKHLEREYGFSTEKEEKETCPVISAEFAPDGHSIALVGEGIILVDPEEGRTLQRVCGSADSPMDAIFSPDGLQILSIGLKGTVLYDLPSGTARRLDDAHRSGVTAAGFSRDGRYLLTGGADGYARIWLTSSWEELCSLVTFDDGSWAVIDPRGHYDSSGDGRNQNLLIMEDGQVADHEVIRTEQYVPGLLRNIMDGAEVLAKPR